MNFRFSNAEQKAKIVLDECPKKKKPLREIGGAFLLLVAF